MKAPELKTVNNQLEIEGNFEFKISEEPLLYDEKELKPYRKIEFYYNPEAPHTMMQHKKLGLDTERLVDLYCEQIKNDFKEFLKNNI